MYGLNRFSGIGRLTSDPELRFLGDGTPVCKMRLAFNKKFKGKDGEKRDKVLFINCTAWKKLAEQCSNILSKGARVYAEGELMMNSWEKKDGTRVETIEVSMNKVSFLDFRAQQAA